MKFSRYQFDRSFIAVMVCLTQFGFATVLILLAGKNTAILLHFFFSIKVPFNFCGFLLFFSSCSGKGQFQINFCWLIVIVGLIVWPVTMLRSPMHFWQVAVFSALSSSLAVCLLVIGFIHDAPVCAQNTSYPAFDLRNFFMAYGTMVFAFGGHAVFPTIQNDMKKPRLFSRSVWVAYVLIVIYYVTVSVMGYSIYGASVGEAIIPSVQLQWVQQTVNLMIALHVITTIVIVFSPLTQQVEEILRIPHHFGWQRFLVRSILFWTVIFVAVSLPNFGPLLDLVSSV
ncbi:transmembrane amino acid transporter protein [Cooperia oncophora]